ncbi:MAG TPA: ACT domain-containing protein [Roseiflexaceae bacterium]|nr:ACT domain-containing protein [Roseiflexaceae bacterium]
MAMTDPRIASLLRQAHWQARPERFVLIGLDPRERLVAARLLAGTSAPFMQMIVETDALTLVLPDAQWRTLRQAFLNARVQAPFRVITFALDLPDDLIGFLAVASRALAEAGVPILAICGYSKDHIMVREEHLSTALAALEALAAS